MRSVIGFVMRICYLSLFAIFLCVGCAANQEPSIRDDAGASASTNESLDTQTQGSPIYNQFNFNNGPSAGSPAQEGTALSQAAGMGLEGDALAQFLNKVKSSEAGGGSKEVTSPGQIYKQDQNTFTFTITSGGTTPTATGGGASGAATASNTANQTSTQTQETRPTLTIPITASLAPGSVAQGGPSQSVADGGTGGAQTNTPEANARAEFLQAENDALKKLIAARMANEVAGGATETSSKKGETSSNQK